ncbi:MAG: hypothetical protein ACOVO1_05035 [Chitinophagaceae bacterium]
MNNKSQLNNNLYKHIEIIDDRTDTNSLGHLFLENAFSDFDRLYEIKNKIPVKTQIKQLFNNTVSDAKTSDTIVLQLRSLIFNELFVNVNWASYFHLRFNTYRKNNKIYYPISTVDTTINFNLVFRYSKRRLIKNARKVFAQEILNSFSTNSDTSLAYSQYEISKIDSIEKSYLPLYYKKQLEDGIYLNYESFKSQQPDKLFHIDSSENGEIKELFEIDADGNLKKIKIKKIYALVSNGKAFISSYKKLIPISKVNDDYFFTNKVFISTSDNEFITKYDSLSKRAINFISFKDLASLNKRTFLLKIDHLNGSFIKMEQKK